MPVEINPYLITDPDEMAEISGYLAKLEIHMDAIEETGDVTEDCPQVLDIIIAEMQDDDDGLRQNRKLIYWYLKSDWPERAWIDRVLAFICGWTLPTLLKKAWPDDTPDTTIEKD